MIKKYDLKIWGGYIFSKLDLGRLESFKIRFGEASQNLLLGIEDGFLSDSTLFQKDTAFQSIIHCTSYILYQQ